MKRSSRPSAISENYWGKRFSDEPESSPRKAARGNFCCEITLVLEMIQRCVQRQLSKNRIEIGVSKACCSWRTIWIFTVKVHASEFPQHPSLSMLPNEILYVISRPQKRGFLILISNNEFWGCTAGITPSGRDRSWQSVLFASRGCCQFPIATERTWRPLLRASIAPWRSLRTASRTRKILLFQYRVYIL